MQGGLDILGIGGLYVPVCLRVPMLVELLQHAPQYRRVAAHAAKLLQNRALQRRSRHAPRLALRPPLLMGLDAHVVAVHPVLLLDVGVDHADVAGCAPDQPLEQGAMLVADVAAAATTVPAEHGSHVVPDLVVHDAVVLAFVDLVAVLHLAQVDLVGQQIVEVVLGDGLAARLPAFARGPRLHAPVAALEFLHYRYERAVFKVQVEDGPDAPRLLLIHHQRAALGHDVVAQDGHAADPFALPARRAHFVASALRNHLPLELRERQQDVQREPSQRTRGVELLRHGHERRAALVQSLHDAGEIQQRPRQAVHLVHDHAVRRARLDVGQQPLQGGAVHIGARVPAVIVLLRKGDPPLVTLAVDERFAGIALCVERVEGLLEAFLGGLAGVDRAADGTGLGDAAPVGAVPILTAPFVRTHAAPPCRPRKTRSRSSGCP